MKKVLLYIILIAANIAAQNAIVGDGFTSGWGSNGSTTNYEYFTAGAGTSFIRTEQANGTGNQYFRIGIDWDETIAQNTINPPSDNSVTHNTEYQLSATGTNSGAMYVNVTSTSHNYIFKTKDASSNPSRQFIFFKVEGDVRSVSSVAKDLSTIYPGQAVSITATLDGAFSTGQGVYLRYTNDNFSTSTVVEMTGSGTSYSASIPTGTNTAGSTVKYYVFTSGNGLTISAANADWYTINLNNNGGANYSYAVESSFTSAQDGNWNTAATWSTNEVPASGVPVAINHNVTLDAASVTTAVLTVAADKTLALGANTLSASTSSISGAGTITISTGTLTGGAISVATLTASGSATINASGNWGVTNFTKGTSTVNFTGTGSYSTATNFYNLTISAGTRTMGAAMDIENNLTVSGTASLVPSGSRTITASGSSTVINVTASGDGIKGTDNSGGNDISLSVSGDLTSITGTTLDLPSEEVKFFSVTVPASKILALSRGMVCKYGTFTVNGTLQLNANGFTRTGGPNEIAPTYGANGILKYNTAGSYNQGNEWLVGQPYVTVANGTTVTMTSSKSVSGELRLEGGGKIILGSNNLTIASGAAVVSDASSFVITNGSGQFRKEFSGTGSFTFPVGENTGDVEYSPVNLSFASGTFNSAYAGVTVTDAKHPDNGSTTHFISRYWTVTSSGITDFSATASFVYVDADINGTEGNLYLGKWNGSSWSLLDAVNSGTNTLSGAVTSFSDFTGGESSALPVELTSFAGKVTNGKVSLNWNTATEVNNYGFEIERAAKVNGDQNVQFAKVGFVEGNGNSNSPKGYSFTDASVTAGKYLYRLKQVDTDGQFEYSQEIEVSVDNLINGYVLEQNYPNPFNPSTSIKFGFQNDTRAEVKVYNVIGAEVATLFNGTADAGRIYEVTFDASGLASGTYFYKLVTPEKTDVRKMILMK